MPQTHDANCVDALEPALGLLRLFFDEIVQALATGYMVGISPCASSTGNMKLTLLHALKAEPQINRKRNFGYMMCLKNV
jgi:hypothetical protein